MDLGEMEGVEASTGLKWLRIEPCIGLLWTRFP